MIRVNSLRTVVRAVTLALLFQFAAVALHPAAAAETLYQRLGGYDAIAGFVDTAFPRVAVHPELTHLFRGHSQNSQMRQRQLIVDSLCAAAGGPCIYTGRDMKPVHAGLGITGAQWTTFMGIISSTANERPWAEADRKEFIDLFTKRFRPDVVEKS
jgi:hemoglobin